MFPFHVRTMKTYLNRVMSDENHPAAYWIGGLWATELFWTCWEEKISCSCHDSNLDCPGNGLLAVSTHKFCECAACCVSCDDHIVLAVKRHIEETAKKKELPHKLFRIVYKEIFSQLFQMFCSVITFITHTHFRFYQSCGIRFPWSANLW